MSAYCGRIDGAVAVHMMMSGSGITALRRNKAQLGAIRRNMHTDLAEALRVGGPHDDDGVECVRGAEVADVAPHLTPGAIGGAVRRNMGCNTRKCNKRLVLHPKRGTIRGVMRRNEAQYEAPAGARQRNERRSRRTRSSCSCLLPLSALVARSACARGGGSL